MTKAKTQELSKSEDDLLEEWRKSSVTPRTQTNFIKVENKKLDPKTDAVNPDFGKVWAISFVDGKEVKKEISPGDMFYPIRDRVQISCRDYVDGENGKRAKYWCEEVDSQEPIELKDSATNEVVYNGAYKGAKEEYNLKYMVSLYVLFEDIVYRWKIGGRDTLGSWFGINNQLNKAGRPHSVILKTVVSQTNNGIYWNDLEFELGEEFDIRRAVELRRELDTSLGAYYAEKKDKKQIETVKEVFPDAEEVKTDDLPF